MKGREREWGDGIECKLIKNVGGGRDIEKGLSTDERG